MKEKKKQFFDAEGRLLKTLYLTIKQKYFDLIMSGQKVQEFREVRPSTIGRLLVQVDDPDDPGRLVEAEDEDGNSIPIRYDAIYFAVGYRDGRDTALVEVKDAYCEVFVDSEGQPLTYEYGGQLWFAQQVVYCLGRILESDIHPKRSK